jgi:signal transduction histidine kinase
MDKIHTILAVDDTVTNLQLLSEYFPFEEYRVLTATSGEKALKRVRNIVPDVILMDVMMPGINGYETCCKIKEIDACRDVLVIFMTALSDVQSKVKAFDAGGVDFVTKPIQREEAIARVKAQLELSDLRKKLEKEIKEKESIISELDAFAQTVAHDLKNPISGIQGMTELLMLEENLPDDVKECLRLLNKSSIQLAEIAKELLLLARVRGENVERTMLDVPSILSQVKTRTQALIDESGAAIIEQDKWPVVKAYSPWIEEVFANYISNAIKYGGNPAVVEVGADLIDDGQVAFWVKDNGKGISEENQKKLFQPFCRLTTRSDSTGLGLSIVSRIIQRFDGQVFVESKEGQGSRFGFILPVAEDE